MDPARGSPLSHAPASVTVLADHLHGGGCLGQALMVAGVEKAAAMAREQGLAALFLQRDGSEVLQTRVGW
jgi:thiamine biosynthesis lipoprotein